MQRIKALLLVGAMTLGTTGTMSFVGAQAASAAGTYPGKALYQLTISQTCTSATICGADNLGGFWAWVALYSDNTGDGQVTFCSHGGSFGNGAGHEALDIFEWSISNGSIVLDQTSDPHIDGFQLPAAPGHYNLNSPGMELQVTVTLNPTA